MSNLYHTYPWDCLLSIKDNDPVFIESEPLLRSLSYQEFFTSQFCSSRNLILDCGVGASPDLNKPMDHVSKDPHWGVWYLRMIRDIMPRVVVVPDSLGCSSVTRSNFYLYEYIIKAMWTPRPPELMYVIQAATWKEARSEIDFACTYRGITWVGFPRLVHYWGDTQDADELAEIRIKFVSSVITKLKDSEKKIHLLGMNNTRELYWAGNNDISCDTRLASLAGFHGFDVRDTRPPNLKIDLAESFTKNQVEAILKNIQILNHIYKE